jgi:hypothetical protein
MSQRVCRWNARKSGEFQPGIPSEEWLTVTPAQPFSDAPRRFPVPTRKGWVTATTRLGLCGLQSTLRIRPQL